MNATKIQGRIRLEGMGGFLSPPSHPTHSASVVYGDRHGSGHMSLDAAVKEDWLDDAIRAEAQRKLDEWNTTKLPLESAEVQDWVHHVLGYYKGCYKGPEGPEAWYASKLRIDKNIDPMLNIDLHAGVHCIREYYPEFVPTAEHFANAYWGTKPERT